ncbi:MFS transporter [Kocuria dechangensis]|uniref:Putative proline/betaine transporter n=1 Tax=Kocuria dechangensis TaxID=1176249 RepID=A0A917GIC8_9MICC|nr:MFS transporter [Kocuria dechangensis]GGG47496.1 MFS transporter [Kocuria dechangensis]
MSNAAPPVQAPRGTVRKVAAASLAGNAIEYYDFSIYGLAAALVFPALFFPQSDPFVGTLATFATMAVGYLSRPVGAVIFGHFGDRIGRKPMLVITLLIMGGATMLIGLLPTYETIGAWAAVLLVTLRLLQGIAFGGEWGGAILMAFEYAPEHRRGFFAAIPQVGPATGSILGNAVFLLVTLLPDEQMLAWGWRIPFLLSAVLVIVGMIIRLKIAESPEFRTVKAEGRAVDVPIIAVLKHHLRPVLLVTGGFLGFGAFSIIVMAYLVNYSTNQAGIDPTVMLSFTLLSFVLQIPTILFFGHLSDRVDRRRLMAVGSVLAMVSIFGMFWAVESHNPWLIMLGYAVGFGCLYPVAYGAQPALFADAFTPEVRFTGMSLGYQGANVLGSGFTPMIAASLLQYTGSPWAIPVFVTLTLVISMFCLMRLATLAAQRKALTSATSRDPQADGVPSIV